MAYDGFPHPSVGAAINGLVEWKPLNSADLAKIKSNIASL